MSVIFVLPPVHDPLITVTPLPQRLRSQYLEQLGGPDGIQVLDVSFPRPAVFLTLKLELDLTQPQRRPAS